VVVERVNPGQRMSPLTSDRSEYGFSSVVMLTIEVEGSGSDEAEAAAAGAAGGAVVAPAPPLAETAGMAAGHGTS
jgi:hypothetical protein